MSLAGATRLLQQERTQPVDLHAPGVWGAPALGTRVWTQRVGALVSFAELVRHLGGDPDVVFARAGVNPTALQCPENRIAYSAFLALLDEAAESTQCPHFGLLAGRMSHLNDLGVIGRLALHSPTVGRALDALMVHQHLNSEGGLVFLLRRGDYVDFGYAIYHPHIVGAMQIYDAYLAVTMNVMTELCGPAWRPYEVFLPHSRGADLAHYRALFKVVPRFDAEFCALRFPARDLARVIESADAEARLEAEQRAIASPPADLLQQVYRALRRLLLENRHSGDDVAQLLAMHRRTLNRRLKAEGMTFQQVLDDVRYEVSRDLLANSNIHLDDIAATLGYAAVTPFMRTFRRWSGTTPGQWRRGARIHRARNGA